MSDQNWRKGVFDLPHDHGWTAKPGNKVFIADRGALRFEIPQGWLVEPSRRSVKFRDAPHPDDTMVLEVTIFYAGYGMNIDWSSLPLHQLIKDVTSDDASTRRGRASRRRRGREGTKRGSPITVKLGNLEMAWIESEFFDPGEKRPANSIQAITRDSQKSIHALLTLSHWPEDTQRAKSVWNDVLGTLKMGEHFDSPLRGPGYNGL